jgi:superfamily I DNA/RNA helicase
LYEEPPTEPLLVDTPWGELWLTAQDWAEAFASAEPGTPHNEARDQVWETMLDILVDQADGDEVPLHQVRRALARHEELTRVFGRAWPLVEASVVVSDLWSVPAYLRRCAPWLTSAEVEALQRTDAAAWTTSDLPLLDAARRRLGDPAASRRRRTREAQLAAEREYMAQVVDRLKEAGDEIMQWLDGDDLRNSLVDEAVLENADPDLLAGPFAHIIVDEAQELTPAEWAMLVRRVPSLSLTVVGDRAQARHGFPESWQERLTAVGLPQPTVATLTINYRTPAAVMAEAAPVIREVLPDANVPTSIRDNGIPVRHARTAERDGLLRDWLATHEEGTACVIGDPAFAATERVRSLTAVDAKGLEFDLVVLAEPVHTPAAVGAGGPDEAEERRAATIEAAVDRYVAMTRTTGELVILDAG